VVDEILSVVGRKKKVRPHLQTGHEIWLGCVCGCGVAAAGDSSDHMIRVGWPPDARPATAHTIVAGFFTSDVATVSLCRHGQLIGPGCPSCQLGFLSARRRIFPHPWLWPIDSCLGDVHGSAIQRAPEDTLQRWIIVEPPSSGFRPFVSLLQPAHCLRLRLLPSCLCCLRL
jgi:hypothetical protein